MLWSRKGKRSAAQEVADLSQDVFLALFQADGKALRAWDPARGMSLDSFVGLLAQHQVISILRSGRTSPWRDDPTEIEELERTGPPDSTPEGIVGSRETIVLLLDRLRATLSPRGLELFQRIVVDEEPIDRLIATTGMTGDAIYQWRSRLLRTARALAAEISAPVMSGKPTVPRIVKGAPQS